MPGPMIGSPPETDHITGAAFPLVSVALNCSTEAPRESIELHPVQLVSMVVDSSARLSAESGPSEIVKLEFAKALAAVPRPQPVSTAMPGTSRTAQTRTSGNHGL